MSHNFSPCLEIACSTSALTVAASASAWSERGDSPRSNRSPRSVSHTTNSADGTSVVVVVDQVLREDRRHPRSAGSRRQSGCGPRRQSRTTPRQVGSRTLLVGQALDNETVAAFLAEPYLSIPFLLRKLLLLGLVQPHNPWQQPLGKQGACLPARRSLPQSARSGPPPRSSAGRWPRSGPFRWSMALTSMRALTGIRLPCCTARSLKASPRIRMSASFLRPSWGSMALKPVSVQKSVTGRSADRRTSHNCAARKIRPLRSADICCFMAIYP